MSSTWLPPSGQPPHKSAYARRAWPLVIQYASESFYPRSSPHSTLNSTAMSPCRLSRPSSSQLVTGDRFVPQITDPAVDRGRMFKSQRPVPDSSLQLPQHQVEVEPTVSASSRTTNTTTATLGVQTLDVGAIHVCDTRCSMSRGSMLHLIQQPRRSLFLLPLKLETSTTTQTQAASKSRSSRLVPPPPPSSVSNPWRAQAIRVRHTRPPSYLPPPSRTRGSLHVVEVLGAPSASALMSTCGRLAVLHRGMAVSSSCTAVPRNAQCSPPPPAGIRSSVPRGLRLRLSRASA
ncbi:hypothetical protein B0H12DRAFT_1231971 [Mycena haematopus]|nr:hypothetical protein B0H12DRAFT_1231971 [Mycena haematopus]